MLNKNKQDGNHPVFINHWIVAKMTVLDQRTGQMYKQTNKFHDGFPDTDKH